jgi:hypothetical protein
LGSKKTVHRDEDAPARTVGLKVREFAGLQVAVDGGQRKPVAATKFGRGKVRYVRVVLMCRALRHDR